MPFDDDRTTQKSGEEDDKDNCFGRSCDVLGSDLDNKLDIRG
jgi:hypothetical protein